MIRDRFIRIFAKNKAMKDVEKIESRETALLVHIEHSKPIELKDFTTSLEALRGLFCDFAAKNGQSKEQTQAKLYVEKIENGCIDIFLCEAVSAGLLPFIENINIILDFSLYIKTVMEYFLLRKGEKPKLDLQEAKNFRDLLEISANDNKGEMSIGAVVKTDTGNVYNNCVFNFQGSNSSQNQIEKDIEEMKSAQPSGNVFKRQLMTIYQIRGDMSSNTGNKAVIDAISPKKLNVVFETDELKRKILNSEENPIRKAYLVDVVLMTVEGRQTAYKVTALHDVIDLSD